MNREQPQRFPFSYCLEPGLRGEIRGSRVTGCRARILRWASEHPHEQTDQCNEGAGEPFEKVEEAHGVTALKLSAQTQGLVSQPKPRGALIEFHSCCHFWRSSTSASYSRR